ncbi:hypothetical protein SCP_0301240 [Sparassis crispa]|uniref:Synaptobrevin n=1 Tax=Sparassis crispa TaxID=139825 RepID=A0A401GE07_9APHY|nr:hypothetical protein SCP_0301240 [Sparassis crispa]GBE80409.1 hypothetical protein SCP_0301240 [Sparassis crispa]
MNENDSEQTVHDRINLARLVRRLEKTVASEDWTDDRHGLPPTWIKTRGTLQKLRHARKLLKNAELNEDLDNAAMFQRYEEMRRTLDRLENTVLEVDKRVSLKAIRPEAILPSLPIPSAPTDVPQLSLEPMQSQCSPGLSSELAVPLSAQDLLLSPSDEPVLHHPLVESSGTILPPSFAPTPTPAKATTSTSNLTPTPAFLQNSAAVHEELSAQLAQMATQLKRNALHFSGSLEADKAVVLAAQEKIERNHEVMTRERGRLKAVGGKTWSTTWIVISSLVVVLIAFVLTFLVIRIT